MKKILISAVGILFCFQVSAQTKNETIDLIVDASRKILPDVLEIHIDLEYKDKKEQVVLDRLTAGLDGQIRSIESAGFTMNQIKLFDFTIDEIDDWESGRIKILGYKAVQSIRIFVPLSEKELLGKLLDTLSIHKNENITISIDAKLSDELTKNIQDELIKKAILDARGKAEIMADALGVKLGGVKSVEYGELSFRPDRKRSIRFIPPSEEERTMAKSTCSYMLLGYSEEDMAEKVHVTWYIE
jgi:uncharacterized protein